ncbi:MAG: hypothetical protein JXL97_07105 [Bacteroidales bacterium]|nr:hypothetical protein [Bacteroidales bacterium]
MRYVFFILSFLLFFSCNTSYYIEYKDLSSNKCVKTEPYGLVDHYSFLYLHIFIKFNSRDTLNISDFSIDAYIKNKDSIFNPVELVIDSNLLHNIIIKPNNSTYYLVKSSFIDTHWYYLYDTNKYQLIFVLNYIENGKDVIEKNIFEPIQSRKYEKLSKRIRKTQAKRKLKYLKN